MNVTRENLNTVMDFDHVVRVHADGTVTDAPEVMAPSLHADELDSPGWTLLDGYSGQYSYAGPIMHNSEYIGGRMADDILSTPGVYVALVNYDADGGDGEGWAVARLVHVD
jgi:hypothetical protein